MIKYILLLLFIPAVFSQDCTSYWVCDDWSSCDMGFQTRECRELANCDIVKDIPPQTKRCDDPNLYEVVNAEASEEIAEDEQDLTAEEMVTESNDEATDEVAMNEAQEATATEQPNPFIGALIILIFVIIGIIIGSKVKS